MGQRLGRQAIETRSECPAVNGTFDRFSIAPQRKSTLFCSERVETTAGP
jgi:hypothetical protein